VKGLVLLASQANGSDPVEALEIPVLSIAGDADCTFTLEEAKAGFARFPDGALFATVKGLTHMGFTADVSLDESNGCVPSDMPRLATLHETLAELVDVFARARIDGEIAALRTLEDGLTGVTFGAD